MSEPPKPATDEIGGDNVPTPTHRSIARMDFSLAHVVITYADGTTASVSGVVGIKLRRVAEAMERYERERRWEGGVDVLDDIRKVLDA